MMQYCGKAAHHGPARHARLNLLQNCRAASPSPPPLFLPLSARHSSKPPAMSPRAHSPFASPPFLLTQTVLGPLPSSCVLYAVPRGAAAAPDRAPRVHAVCFLLACCCDRRWEVTTEKKGSCACARRPPAPRCCKTQHTLLLPRAAFVCFTRSEMPGTRAQRCGRRRTTMACQEQKGGKGGQALFVRSGVCCATSCCLCVCVYVWGHSVCYDRSLLSSTL